MALYRVRRLHHLIELAEHTDRLSSTLYTPWPATTHNLSACPRPSRSRIDKGYAYVVFAETGSDPFAGYQVYRDELKALLERFSNDARIDYSGAAAHLDGLAYDKLRQNVSVQTRRAYNTFFTSSLLRTRLVTPYRTIIARGATVLDPTCGVGDLLIAATDFLPRKWSGSRISQHIATHFYGRETVPMLTAVAQDRLRLAIKLRDPLESSQSQLSLPLIRTGDGLANDVPYNDARLVLLNPPYGRQVAPASIKWAEGLLSQAAPFTLDVLTRCKAGTYIAAILPDVLRSGSRYAKWRELVSQLAYIEKIESVGLFDIWTDVDVFILTMRARNKDSQFAKTFTTPWYESKSPGDQTTLAELANVSVGDVVPHRHAEAGPEVPYLSIHSVPIGATVTHAPTRAFQGRLHQTPFIVVRRTSAPTREGASRLAPSLISEKLGMVAVENHLIIIKPHASGIAECSKLMQQLRHPSVTTWLNARLRTRHITKPALLEIPLPNLDHARSD